MASNDSIIHSDESSQHGGAVLYAKASLIRGARCEALIHSTELVSVAYFKRVCSTPARAAGRAHQIVQVVWW